MTRKERMLVLADQLTKAERGSPALDGEIARVLGRPECAYTSDWNAAYSLVGARYDWIVTSVNGHVGGTPYATVGHYTRYGETPILSLCAAALTAYGSDPRFVYAIGYKDDCGAYGLTNKVSSLAEVLECTPQPVDGRVAYVIEFEGNYNRIVARWSPRAERWIQR